ncbi:MAG: hypothetical protein COB38_06030 [Gammaproteobacteria bacterium]|nr:MAG: hypothetical protein COB38_06030 [Gammaproteobacteria bacterium]
MEDVLFHFSYPAEGLKATPASLDGRPVVAYVVGPIDAAMGNTNDPSDFDMPIGRVIQIRTADGGIQNQTLRDHGMFNGTITRKVISLDGKLGIWTHGIGINRSIGNSAPGIASWGSPVTNFIRRKLAGANDALGVKAFVTLDAQAKEYWSANYEN